MISFIHPQGDMKAILNTVNEKVDAVLTLDLPSNVELKTKKNSFKVSSICYLKL